MPGVGAVRGDRVLSAMGYRLSPEARADGHRLHVHGALASTNGAALERARGGETGPLWIVAERQTAGRGRRGAAWTFLDGNLAASLLYPVDGIAPERVATLGFVAGVSLVEALEAACGTPPGLEAAAPARAFRLKWPNDVVAGGAKLAGILLEAETLPGGRRAVVIGLGVNVAGAPDGLPYPATALSALGCAADAGEVFERCTGFLAANARLWNGGRGLAAIRARWLARAAGLGSCIAVRSGGETVSGIFETIDEAGRLIIRAGDETVRTVTAGEVHFGTAATAA